MTPSEFVAAISRFNQLGHSDKIRAFSWYLHTHKARETFSTADITRCFDDAHLHRPANTSQMLGQLAVQKILIKTSAGYRLSSSARDQLGMKYGARSETVLIDQLLLSMPARLNDVASKEYLEEALVCFRNHAFRAAIIMTWNVTYAHLLHVLTQHHLSTFNSQLVTMFGGKKKAMAGRDDFQRLREAEVLETCAAANITSKEVSKVLAEKLNKRNSAAHPSGTHFDKLQTEAFISDLVNNAFLKLK